MSNDRPAPFPSPPAYRQAGTGEREGVRGFGILNFGHWDLSGIWCLSFGAFYA